MFGTVPRVGNSCKLACDWEGNIFLCWLQEITQQELCDVESVQLVEQCARFHIHCCARLVAEDVSVFDHRINTENLTKCLQTLKHMYYDLWVKHNETCPNEPEFMAYFLLLNLNNGTVMWWAFLKRTLSLQDSTLKPPHVNRLFLTHNKIFTHIQNTLSLRCLLAVDAYSATVSQGLKTASCPCHFEGIVFQKASIFFSFVFFSTLIMKIAT